MPTPVINIIAPSRFYTGQLLNMTCQARLDMRLEYQVNISSQWNSSSILSSADFQVSEGEEVGLWNQSTGLFTVDKGDEGEYTCTVTVTPIVGDCLFRSPVTVMSSQVIEVDGRKLCMQKVLVMFTFIFMQ